MASLQIKLKGKILSSISLDEGKTYLAGRRDDCEIVLLPEKGISREHFKLFYRNSDWYVEGISKYGALLIGGENITESCKLDDKSTFTVSDYEFEFSSLSTPYVPRQEGDIPNQEEFTGDEKTYIGVSTSIPYVKILNNIGEAKELFRLEGGDSWSAGRDANSAIIIRDQKVSRRQFEIRKVNGQYYITDMGSVNGTLLNGKVISDELIALKSGDSISVLDNMLVFEIHDSNFNQKMELVQVPAAQELIFKTENLPNNFENQGHFDAPAHYEMTAPMPMGHQQIPSMHYPGYPQASKGKFDFEKNRPKIIVGAILLLLCAWFFAPSDSGNKQKGTSDSAKKQLDPFSRLKPEEQLLVKQTHQLAKNYYMSGKYELAQSEISKIYQLVPDYEDVRQIERLSREAIAIQDQKRRQEELEKVRKESEIAILKRADECEKKINPNITVDEIEECLSSVISLDPSHPRILELKSKAEALTEDRAIKESQQAEYKLNVARLQNIFNKAEEIKVGSDNLGALEAYQKVINSSLPDPRGLKSKAKNAISRINSNMDTQTAKLTSEADKLYASQNLKGAINALKKALKVDPNNTQLVDKIDSYTNELRKQMMTLYQEGILEESFGNVDGSDSKPGAKDRWKRILELDVTNGEYYKKAYIKLKKYGAL